MKEADIYKVANSLANLLPVIGRKFIRPIEQHAKQVISPLAVHALIILEEKGTSTMTELAKEMNMAKQQLTPIMDKLIESNLVHREHDEIDRRSIKIGITPSGFQFLGDLQKDVSDNVKERIECLDEEDLIALQNAVADLQKIIEKIKP